MKKEERKEYNKEYYKKNKDKEIKRTTEYAKNNPKVVAKKNKKFRENNPEKVKGAKKKWMKKNKEHLKRYNRNYMAEYRRRNKKIINLDVKICESCEKNCCDFCSYNYESQYEPKKIKETQDICVCTPVSFLLVGRCGSVNCKNKDIDIKELLNGEVNRKKIP